MSVGRWNTSPLSVHARWPGPRVRLCALVTGFTKISKYSVNPLTVLKSLLFQCCFAECKKVYFHSPRTCNSPTLTSSERTHDHNSPFTTEHRVERQTRSLFFLVGQVPVCSCAVKIVLWDCCHVAQSEEEDKEEEEEEKGRIRKDSKEERKMKRKKL